MVILGSTQIYKPEGDIIIMHCSGRHGIKVLHLVRLNTIMHELTEWRAV